MVGTGDGVINFVNKMERGIADGVGGALTQKAAASRTSFVFLYSSNILSFLKASKAVLYILLAKCKEASEMVLEGL